MIRKCPVCGIMFDVLYPDLWRFKRNHIFYCTYSCLKLSDEGVKEMAKITKEQKQKAVDIALDGGNQVAFLKECGCMAPDQMWAYIKKTLKAKEPEVYAKLLLKAVDKAPTVKFEDVKKAIMETPQIKVDGPIRIETKEPAQVEVLTVGTPVPPPFEYKTTGISTAIGDFQYYKRNDYLDWTPIGNCNDTVSLKVEEWNELLKVLPEAAKVLGVDINGR